MNTYLNHGTESRLVMRFVSADVPGVVELGVVDPVGDGAVRQLVVAVERHEPAPHRHAHRDIKRPTHTEPSHIDQPTTHTTTHPSCGEDRFSLYMAWKSSL